MSAKRVPQAAPAASERGPRSRKSKVVSALGLDPTVMPVAAPGTLLPRPPRVVRDLNTASGWLKELASIYRSARRGQLDSSEASRLAYIAGVASKIARDVQELREIADLRAAVERAEAAQGMTAIQHQPHHEPAGQPLVGDLMPRATEDGEGQP